MQPRITLHASHEAQLQAQFAEHDGNEVAAIVLFRRIARPVEGLNQSDRFVSVEVIKFEPHWTSSRSASHVAFELRHFRSVFQRCEAEALVFGFVHNHPTGFSQFSEVDEENEQTLLRAIANRNGPDVSLVALLWTSAKWLARTRQASDFGRSFLARHILLLARPVSVFLSAEGAEVVPEYWARQAAAFGKPFVDKMRSLRVGVVGAGGTGSPTITLLARSGVGEIVIVDNDVLERSNLNRVRGAGTKDVGKSKAAILRDFLSDMGLPTHVVAVPSLIDQDPIAIDALSTCDFIFGCTDDQIGREVLNSCVYVYGIPLIDVGLGGQVSLGADGQPVLRYHHGRNSTVLPEEGECLVCQQVIRPEWIRHQYAIRQNPDLTITEANDRYLVGGGEQAPGVGPFTSATADLGIATFYDLLSGFRKFPPEIRWDYFMVDFVKMEFRSAQESGDKTCPYCKTRTYFMMNEKYRLGRPALGKPHVAI